MVSSLKVKECEIGSITSAECPPKFSVGREFF